MNRKKILIFPAALVCILFAYCGDDSPPPRARAGGMDLSRAGLDLGRVVALSGEWEFVPGEFMSPAEYLYWTELDFRRKMDTHEEGGRFFELPGDWKSFGLPSVKDGRHGTFILRLTGVPTDQDLAVRVGRIGAAYRLFMIPAKHLDLVRERLQPEELPFRPLLRRGYADEIYSVPHFGPGLASFATPDDSLYVMLHVANHDSPRGGLLEPILFGSEKKLRRGEEVWRLIHYAFFGFLAALGLLHTGRMLRGVLMVDVFFLLVSFLGLVYLFLLSHRAEDFFPGFDRDNFYLFRRAEYVVRALFLAVWLSYPLWMRRIALPPRPALVLLWLPVAAYAVFALFADLSLCEEYQSYLDRVFGGVLVYILLGIGLSIGVRDLRGLPWLVSVLVLGGAFLLDLSRPEALSGRLPLGLLATTIISVLASNLFGGRSIQLAAVIQKSPRLRRVWAPFQRAFSAEPPAGDEDGDPYQ